MLVGAEMTQWGVGHGGFHTGEAVGSVGAHESVVLRYIFDCGSTAPKQKLRPQLLRYLATLRSNAATNIDALYISHFDYDHVNGLTQLSYLIQPDIRIDRVYAPFLTPAQKLALLVSKQSSISRSYVDLVLDPQGTLAQLFEGAEIELVYPDEADGPPLDGAQPPPSDGIPTSGSVAKPRVVASRGTVSISVPANAAQDSRKDTVLWELFPFVEPSVTTAADQFWADARADPKMPELSPGPEPTRSDIDLMLTKYRKQSRKLAIDLMGEDGSNASSIVLYSGPSAQKAGLWRLRGGSQYAPGRKWLWPRPLNRGGGAWLSTGDARLEQAISVERLQKRIGAERAQRVSVIAAPHHGSKNNSGTDLWDAFAFAQYVSIHATGSGHHPHGDVKREIRRQRRHSLLVNDFADDLTMSYFDCG